MSEKKKFYITTPIYYPSDKLHIGHAYCTVATDAMARYKRLCGYDVMFLTGTDEHGQKIEDKAKAAGVSPKEYVDNIVEGPQGVKDLWKLMNISNDRFIRTTDDYHVAAIQKIFKKMYEKGDIYKGKYVGKYCKPCESFWTETQLVDGKCPDCGREVQDAEEEAYFFRLSKYADRIQDLLENTDFLEPRSRVNEMVNNFIKPGLEDLCVSRTSFQWGVPVDFDPGHVVYVWIDALSNYITALQDETFLHAFWFTVAFTVVSTLSINLLAFVVALVLTRGIKGTNIFRTVFFLPNLIGGIVLGYIWQILINCVLSLVEKPLLGLNTPAGYWGLIVLMAWQQVGYMMIIYIAGLQNVSPDLLEAAAIDGANSWQTLIKIKLPMVMSSLTICLFLTLTNSFKLFDQNLSLTAGEPNHATEMLALNIYNTFYARSGPQWKGIGQAKAVIFFVVVVIIALVQLKATRSKEVQQ